MSSGSEEQGPPGRGQAPGNRDRGDDPRRLALDVLVRVEAGEASDRALDRALRRRRLDDRDRRLATELVYGVLRRQRSLDAALAPFCDRPLPDLDPPLRAGLRLGAYQVRHLDQVPLHAAVHATVEAVKGAQRAGAGLVNGVLRAWLREDAPEPPDDGSPGLGCDLPDWWARRWQERWGEAGDAWMSATLEPAPLALRFHPWVADPAEMVAGMEAAGVELEPSEHVPDGWRVTAGTPLGTPAFRIGGASLRSEASQMVPLLLTPDPEEPVLDACAGRGGKTVQLAEDSGAPVVALDRAHWRTLEARQAARRARLSTVWPVVADLTEPAPFDGPFRWILLDAPCSGLGTVRRRPEVKWRTDPERLERLGRLQRSLLRSTAGALAPGGTLLYVTCSTEPEENEQVVEAVLEENPALAAKAPDVSRLPRGERLVDADGYFRTYPTFPDLDGFFAAALTRRAGVPGGARRDLPGADGPPPRGGDDTL